MCIRDRVSTQSTGEPGVPEMRVAIGRLAAPRAAHRALSVRAMATNRTTHFGNSEVAWDEKEHLVKKVFNNVASNYDVMNDLMSGGVHRLWKDELIKQLNPTPYMKLLDVAGGTGDIGFRFLDHISGFKGSSGANTGLNVEQGGALVVCDINEEMLKVGEQRFTDTYGTDLESKGISFMVGDAMDLHDVPESSVDAYTISFGLRNVTDQPKALREAFRVLRDGGRLLVMEFSHVENPLLRTAYQQYSDLVIPEIGNVVAGDRDSYKYLVESIRKMPKQDQLASMLEDAGFKQVVYRNLTFGVVAIHAGVVSKGK
eukprot:TRINITY_DN13695_c0_g1_i1.p1 TRINITY_DN13695_c0_g1~~TRINITY_DN13695_c0_g1_i1.p1  ORF type:complete len:314 (+),score=71.56 TRINITY_DN13695_c0_g1_i1:149-1090(+)